MENEQEFHVKIADRLGGLEQIARDILTQTLRTNGRVTKLEETVATHSAKILLNDAVDAAALLKANWWKDKIGSAIIALVFTALGSVLLLLLQRTNIVDVSVVSDTEYQQLP